MATKKKTSSKKSNLHTISLFVANKPGVLVRIALVFARRGFNIDSLVVSPAVNERFSRMTITAQGNVETLDQIIKQCAKLVDVVHASEHVEADSVTMEMALVKVRVKSSNRNALQKLIKQYHTKVVDMTDESAIIEQTGTTAQLDEFEGKLKKYGIIEMVRSGKLVMACGKEPT